jgi:hypothetical protein
MRNLGDNDLDVFRLICLCLGLIVELAMRLRGARGALGIRRGLGLRRALRIRFKRLGLLDFDVRVETIAKWVFLFISTSDTMTKKYYPLLMRTRIVPLHTPPPRMLDFLQAKSTLEEPLLMQGLMLQTI